MKQKIMRCTKTSPFKLLVFEGIHTNELLNIVNSYDLLIKFEMNLTKEIWL